MSYLFKIDNKIENRTQYFYLIKDKAKGSEAYYFYVKNIFSTTANAKKC